MIEKGKGSQPIHATQDLLLKERHFREVLENINLLAILLDVNGKVTFCNPFLLNLTGYTYEEMIGSDWFELMISEKNPQTKEVFLNALKSGDIVTHFENPILTKNKELLHILWNNTVLRDQNGTINGTASIGENITERKLAEEKLKINEARLNKGQEIGHLGYWQQDIGGNNIWASAEAKKIYGFPPVAGELPIDRITTCITDLELVRQATKDLIDNNKKYNIEFRINPADGSFQKIISSIAELERDKDGKPVRLMGVLQDITEQKQTVGALRESEELYHSLFENMLNSFAYCKMHFDENGRPIDYTFLSVNRVFEAQTGLKNVVGKKVSEVVPAFNDQDRELLEIYGRVSKTGKPVHFEMFVNSMQMWYSISLYSPKEGYFVAVFEVITERKQAEEKLKASENKFRELFEENTDGIGIFSISEGLDALVLIDMNENSAKMIGYSKEEMFNINPSDFERSITKEETERRVEELKSKGISSFETILKHRNGNDIDVEVKTKVITYNNLPAVMNIVRDITDRKRTQETLKESEMFLKETQVIANLGTYTLDITSGKWESSEILNKIFGIDSDYDKTVEGWASIVHPEWQKIMTDYYIQEVVGNKTKFNKEYKIIRQNDKAERWVHGIGNLKFNEFNQPITMVGTIQDITESKNIEKELIKAKDKAEESDRLKSAFLTNMSHEIRTPMNGILGFTELLKGPDLSSEDLQDFIGTIEKSGERMLNTLNDIIDFSKIDSGLMKVNIKESDVNEQIEFISKFFKPETERKGLRFSSKCSLPSNEAIIHTDAEKIYSILTSLVKNAIKFTDKGSIEFGYEKKGKYLEFFVRDTGIGIPEMQKDIIFDRFRQGSESLDRNYEGSGLGLSISKSYVEMLGGKIWMESEKGKGSVFYFTIPYNIELKEKKVINVDYSRGRTFQMKNLNVLIVEDDETSHSLLTKFLQNICHKLLHAKTGIQAIETCCNNPDLDLILMDIKMPEMNGYEATRQIRQFNADVIIIAQTAYALAGEKQKAIEAGCNDFITKPINKTLLFELISKQYNNV